MVDILYAYDKVTWRDDQEQKTHTISDDQGPITTISQVVSIDFHEIESHPSHIQNNNSIIRIYEITMAYINTGGSDSVFIEMKKIAKNNVDETESFGIYNLAKDTILPMTAKPITNTNGRITYNCFFPSTGSPAALLNVHLQAKRVKSIEGENESEILLSLPSPIPATLRVSDTNIVSIAGKILTQDIIFGFTTT